MSAPGEGGYNAGSSGALENQKSYAGPAPTYVENVYRKAEGGPKGKNLKEVESFEGEGGAEDGQRAAMQAEPGSEQDPGRAAEARFGLRGEPGKGGVARAGEPGESRYAALDETSA